MEYIRYGSELLDCLKQIIKLAEKIYDRMYLSSPKLANLDIFLKFFMQRRINAAKSVVLLLEHEQYQDALIIARNAIESLYYVMAIFADDSLANKWVLFYVFEKYREEYEFHGKAAAERLLETQFEPDLVADAKGAFGNAFENPTKRVDWHDRGSITALSEELVKKRLLSDNFHSTYYATFSKIVHLTPFGVIDAKAYSGLALEVTFVVILLISENISLEYVLGLDSELMSIERHFIECVRSQL